MTWSTSRVEASGSKDIIDDHQRFYMTVEGTDLDWTIKVEEAVAPSR